MKHPQQNWNANSITKSTIQDRRIVTQSPNCERPKNLGESYDRLEEVK